MEETPGKIKKHRKWALVFSRTLFIIIWLAGACVAATAQEMETAIKIPDTTAILKLISDGNSKVDKYPEDALQLFLAALRQSRQVDFLKGIALSSVSIGKWYFGSNIDTTIYYGRLALQLYDKTNIATVDDKAEVRLLLAEAYDEQGRKDSSAYYYYYLVGSEQDFGKIKDPQFAIRVYTKLSIFWSNLDYGTNLNDEHNKTIARYVEKAKETAASLKDTANAASAIYFLQGAYYQGLKQFDSARYYYLLYFQQPARFGKLGLPRLVATLANIADTYLQQNRPALAMVYINKIEEEVQQPNNNKYTAFYLQFNNLLKGKALYQQQQYAKAISIIESTLIKMKATGSHLRNEVVEAYKILALCYEVTGNYRQALTQKNTYLIFYDSLMKKDKIDMINSLAIRYRIAEKDKELTEQKLTIVEVSNRVRARNYFIGGIVSLAVFITLAFGLWRRKNIHKQKLQQEKIDNLQQKMEIERLNATIDGEEKERARIARELHDGIGGLLTAAKMNFELVRKSIPLQSNTDLLDGIKLLEETSAGLRETAQNIIPEILLQEGLASAIRSFCERMTGKGGTIINFQTIGKNKILNATFDLPVYRIVQELIHNIRKHARANTALVQMNFFEDGGLDITVEDDGFGMATDSIQKSTGMGLRNVTERTKQLGGKLDIKSLPGKGTSIYLEFESGKQTSA